MRKHSLKEKFLIFKVKQKKDAQAYGELYDLYVDRIFRFIFFKVSVHETAEDLTSEVFLKTWEYINKTNKKIDNLNSLLYKIARNIVIDFYRARKMEAVKTDEEYMQKIEDNRSIEEETNRKVSLQSIEKHLNKLKDIYKEVIILKYIEEFSLNEIADIIGKTKVNTRVLLHRALQALKEIAGE